MVRETQIALREYEKLPRRSGGGAHRDKIMIRDALSVYMTDFWKEYGRLMAALPVEGDKITG